MGKQISMGKFPTGAKHSFCNLGDDLNNLIL